MLFPVNLRFFSVVVVRQFGDKAERLRSKLKAYLSKGTLSEGEWAEK